MESDIAYFTRRAEEEQIAATRADHPMARRAHLEMADLYGCLVALLVANEHRLGTEDFGGASVGHPEPPLIIME